MPELDGVLTLSQRMLGVMKPRPLTTLHVGGGLTVDGPVVDLPAGSVGTDELAANSVTLAHPGWFTPSAWQVPTPGAWCESDVRVTFTPTSATSMLLVYFMCSATLPSGAQMYVGLGLDGAISYPSLQVAANAAPAQGVFPMSGMLGIAPQAGTHRISLWGFSGSTASGFFNGANAYLAVVEHKR